MLIAAIARARRDLTTIVNNNKNGEQMYQNILNNGKIKLLLAL